MLSICKYVLLKISQLENANGLLRYNHLKPQIHYSLWQKGRPKGGRQKKQKG